LIAACLAAFAGFLPSLFSDNTDVIGIAELYLWTAPVSYGAYGVVMAINASFNGLGSPMPAVGISVGRMLVLYVPLAIVGMKFFDAAGIFAAYAAANIISGAIAYQWAKATVHRRCGGQPAASG